MKENAQTMFAVLALAWLLTSCQSVTTTTNQTDSTAIDRPTVDKSFAVSTQFTRVGVFALRSAATGLIRAPAQSRLSFRIGGTIHQIAVHNGSPVVMGQVLSRLDDQDQRMALRLAQDQVAEAQVQLRALIAEYGGQGVDTIGLKPNVRSYVLTKSGYYKAQTALAQARQQLDYTLLRAPYAGVVANLATKPYNFITSFEPFCTLLSRSSLLVEFSVLESELVAVKVGQPVRVTPVSMPGRSYAGQVLEINPFVNGQGLVLVKARINRPDSNLFEGMNAHVVIERLLPKQLVVPKSAVVERSGRKVVFTVEEGLAKWHYVTIAYENDEEVVISEGLEAGAQIIVSGNLNLAHDAPVSVANL